MLLRRHRRVNNCERIDDRSPVNEAILRTRTDHDRPSHHDVHAWQTVVAVIGSADVLEHSDRPVRLTHPRDHVMRTIDVSRQKEKEEKRKRRRECKRVEHVVAVIVSAGKKKCHSDYEVRAYINPNRPWLQRDELVDTSAWNIIVRENDNFIRNEIGNE